MKMIRRIAWWILVAAIPVALFLEFTHSDKILLFIASAMAVLPVAAWVRKGSTLGAMYFLPMTPAPAPALPAH